MPRRVRHPIVLAALALGVASSHAATARAQAGEVLVVVAPGAPSAADLDAAARAALAARGVPVVAPERAAAALAFRAPDGVLTGESATALRTEMSLSAVIYVEARQADATSLYLAIRLTDGSGARQEFASATTATLATTVGTLLSTLLAPTAPTAPAGGPVMTPLAPGRVGVPASTSGPAPGPVGGPAAAPPYGVAPPGAYGVPVRPVAAAPGTPVSAVLLNWANVPICEVELRDRGRVVAADNVLAEGTPLAVGTPTTVTVPAGSHEVVVRTCAGNFRRLGWWEFQEGTTFEIRFVSRFPGTFDIGLQIGSGLTVNGLGGVNWMGFTYMLELGGSIALNDSGFGLGVMMAGGLWHPFNGRDFVDPAFFGYLIGGASLPNGDLPPSKLGAGVLLINDVPFAAIGFQIFSVNGGSSVLGRVAMVAWFSDRGGGWVLSIGGSVVP